MLNTEFIMKFLVNIHWTRELMFRFVINIKGVAITMRDFTLSSITSHWFIVSISYLSWSNYARFAVTGLSRRVGLWIWEQKKNIEPAYFCFQGEYIYTLILSLLLKSCSGAVVSLIVQRFMGDTHLNTSLSSVN